MSQFNFNDYNKVVNKAQSGSTNSSAKIGYFKLGVGEEALIRINCSSVDELKFATVHSPIYGKKYEGLGSGFTPVSCLNEVGSYSDNCPFCKAAAEGHAVVGKAAKKVYVEMLVAYADKATGGWTVAQPVVWERPAGFANELAAKIKGYGSLKEVVFKISRTGVGKETRYLLDFIPVYNKPECVPTDFSAFENFNIAKHSFWEKTAEEMNEYLVAGQFPDNANKEAESSVNYSTARTASTASAAPAYQAPVTPATSAPVTTAVETSAPATTPAPAAAPARNFGNYSF